VIGQNDVFGKPLTSNMVKSLFHIHLHVLYVSACRLKTLLHSVDDGDLLACTC
jgi:hypothetical protein